MGENGMKPRKVKRAIHDEAAPRPRTFTRAVETGDRYAFLDSFRGLAVILVVATHVLDYTQMPQDLKTSITFWVQAIAVPPFFLADGFLCLWKLERNDKVTYGAYLRRSAGRLLVPWMLFSLIYAAFRWIFEEADPSAQPVIKGQSPAGVASAIYYSAVSAQLYFLPALFLLRCALPLTRGLAKADPLMLVGVWSGYVIVWQAVDLAQYFEQGLDPVLNACWGMQYYLLGMVLFRYRALAQTYAAMLSVASGAVLVLLKWLVPVAGLFQQYGYLFFALFAFMSLQGRDPIFAGLGRYTMEIYLLHAPIPLKAASLVAGRAMESTSVLYYVTVTVLTFVMAYAVAVLLRRKTAAGLVFGSAS
jgi:surface polysaccharide O-acyltransferase-like enzyme